MDSFIVVIASPVYLHRFFDGDSCDFLVKLTGESCQFTSIARTSWHASVQKLFQVHGIFHCCQINRIQFIVKLNFVWLHSRVGTDISENKIKNILKGFTQIEDKLCPAPFADWVPLFITKFIGLVMNWGIGRRGGGRIMIFLRLRNNILFLSMDEFRCVKSPLARPCLPSSTYAICKHVLCWYAIYSILNRRFVRNVLWILSWSFYY